MANINNDHKKGVIQLAISDWVEILDASEERFIGQTAQVVDLRGTNVRVEVEGGESFWTDSENLSIC